MAAAVPIDDGVVGAIIPGGSIDELDPIANYLAVKGVDRRVLDNRAHCHLWKQKQSRLQKRGFSKAESSEKAKVYASHHMKRWRKKMYNEDS